MNDPPKASNESLFAGHMKIYLIINGLLIGILTLFAFKLGEKLYPNSLIHAQTMAFVVLSISQLFFALNMRNTKKSIFEIGLFTNKYLILSLLLGIIIQVVIITVPFFSNLFKVYSLSFTDWILVFLISIIPLAVNELLKLHLRR